jgi:hypothetical protein
MRHILLFAMLMALAGCDQKYREAEQTLKAVDQRSQQIQHDATPERDRK